MTSRLDRLFSLLEHCPNATLRAAAANQLGQLAKKAPAEVDQTLTRLNCLLHSKSWTSRVAAAEAIRAIVGQLPTWTPSKSDQTQSTACEVETSDSSSFLSLSNLRLDRVLANGARLYSMNQWELTRMDHQTQRTGTPAKRGRKSTVNLKEFSETENEQVVSSLKKNRSVLNRQMGLNGDNFIASVLAEHSGTSMDSLISDDDLKEDTVDEQVEETSPNVMESVKQSYEASKPEKRKHSAFDETVLRTDWPLDCICVRLLADLWDFRWETRHGAASGLRELLFHNRHTRQAGKKNEASETENAQANRVYIEDIVVRVLCTLTLDQFSDFVCDEVIAPVRETAAQLLGVLSRHLDFDQIKEVTCHLLSLISMHDLPSASTAVSFNKTHLKTTWMVVHSGLLGVKYLLTARSDLSKQLLPLVCESLVRVLIHGGSCHLAATNSAAGEEDIRSAACAALLAVSDDLIGGEFRPPTDLSADCGFAEWLTNQIWALLETSNELSPATGPLLVLASKLITASSKDRCSLDKSPKVLVNRASENSADAIFFVKRVELVIHFLHHSLTSIRKTSIDTLQSLIMLHVEQGHEIDLALLEAVFEQLFHRILFETETELIWALSKLWRNLIEKIPLESVVPSTLHRVDFWLCQVMQPTSTPYPDNLLKLPSRNADKSFTKNTTDTEFTASTEFRRYIGGQEMLAVSETERQAIALETRLTAISLLAILCNRLCESSTSVLWSLEAQPNGRGNSETGISVSGYLLGHLLESVHLKDRLAMQRFVASLLLAAWPPPNTPWPHTELHARIQSCLTNVTYYEEILGVFKSMQEDCRRLVFTCEEAGISFAEGALPKTDSILNLVQCQSLLKSVSQNLTAVSSTTRSPETLSTLGLDLPGVFRKAQLSVHRCLSCQLFWSSRVELAVASAMVNVGWVVSGRLTLFIRPFMETIRGVSVHQKACDSTGVNDIHQSLFIDLPCTAESLRLQALAAWNLARLLYLEWMELEQQCPSTNPSKALAKVTENLSKYLVSSDPVLSTIASFPPESESNVNLTSVTVFRLKTTEATSNSCTSSSSSTWSVASFSSQPPDPCTRLEKPSGDVESGGGGDGDIVITIKRVPAADPQIVQRAALKEVQNHRQRAGSLLALGSLLRIFNPVNEDGPSFLECRMPTFWAFLWSEPIALLKSLFRPPTSATTDICTFDADLSFLRQSLSEKFKNEPRSLAPAEDDVLIRSLSLMLPVFTVNCAPFSHLQEGLLILCLRCLLLKPARIRYMASHLLAVAPSTFEGTVGILNTALMVLLPRLKSSNNIDKLAAMEAIYHIIDGIITPPEETLLSQLRLDSLLSPDLHGCSLDRLRQHTSVVFQLNSQATDLETSITHNGDVKRINSSAYLQTMLSYVVVMLTSILPSLADSCPDVRILANHIFSKLLILLPLEDSVEDPEGMHQHLKTARCKGHEFVHCLLHPGQIQLYEHQTRLINAQLRPYQHEGVNWLLFLRQYGLNGILADDLGLGKTLQTICLLANHYGNTSSSYSSLVICPATLCSHWLAEVIKFRGHDCHLRPIIYQGTQDFRLQLQNDLPNFNLVISTYEVVRNDLPLFENTVWEYVILDEGHIIKNWKSKLSVAVKKVSAKHRLILTGTPVQNRIGELWSLFDFLMPGLLGNTEAVFASRFGRMVSASRDPKASANDQRAGQLALEELHRVVLPFVLRRMKEDVLQDLPPKVIQDYVCYMTPLQMKLYSEFVKTSDGQHALDLVDRKHSVVVDKPQQDKTAASPKAARPIRHGFQSMKYMLSVCNHPCLVLDSPEHPLHAWATDRLNDWSVHSLQSVELSGKLMALRQLLIDCGFRGLRYSFTPGEQLSGSLSNEVAEEELMSQHRALIFFQTKKMLSLVANLLNSEFKGVTFSKLDGSVSVSDRHSIVTRFNQDPSIDVLLLTTFIGGLGLNLTGADTVIFVEHDWNPCKDLQAMDRAHRIGQKRMVNVYRLITAESIEERIMCLQTFKMHIARTLVSQQDNSSLSDMDTGNLFDNLVASTGQSSALFAQNIDEKNGLQWGDVEAAQYAEEFDMNLFVSRHSQC